MNTRQRVWKLASAQHGVVATRQLRARGLDRDDVHHLVARHDLEPHCRGVLRIPGSPTTPEQRLMTAVLAAGRVAALSHTSSLARWGVNGFQVDPLHVSRHRDDGDRPLPGTTIHEVRDLPLDHVRVLHGVPLVTPALALLQLSGMHRVSHERLELAIDAAWSARLVSFETLTAIGRRMSKQGRRGLVRLRDLVEERGPDHVPPASNLEGRFAQILKRVGRAPLRRQVDTGDEHWIGRVDFRDPDLPLIVEVQSELFHTSLSATAHDRQRRARLEAAGFVVVEVTEEAIFFRPDAVVRAVDDGRTEARALLQARRPA